jgi:hypothetical protein
MRPKKGLFRTNSATIIPRTYLPAKIDANFSYWDEVLGVGEKVFDEKIFDEKEDFRISTLRTWFDWCHQPPAADGQGIDFTKLQFGRKTFRKNFRTQCFGQSSNKKTSEINAQ